MAIDVPDTSLTANDKRILNALFDPETLPSSITRSKDASSIDSSLPAHPAIPSSQFALLETQQNELVRKANTNASTADIDAALAHEDSILEQWPQYPSAYLNRGMLRRMKVEASSQAQDSIFTAPKQDLELLFGDLAGAITSSGCTSPESPVSPYQARILRTAFTHRAYLYLKASKAGVVWDGKSKSELEELASVDFTAAARYGDEVAREMSVRTNPYAKMCGAIVRNALQKEREAAK